MMNRTKWMVLAFSLVLGILILSLVDYWMLTSTVRAQQGSAPSTVCPLSEAQTQKSIQAFDKIAAVFTQQPRCANCHGAVDPFVKDADKTHVGGHYDIIEMAVPNPSALPGSGQPMTITVQDTAATFDQCKECHGIDPDHPDAGGFTGDWMLAPQSLSFVGKDAITLCKQQKDAFNRDAGAFLDHIEHDASPNNPFIQEGFKGTKGLNDVGQSMANPPYPDPPHGVMHEDLIQFAHDWVDANGGKFKGDIECGCVPHHYALKIDYQLTSDGTFNGATVHAVISMKGQVPLNIQDDTSFSGQVPLPYTYKFTTSFSGQSCEGGYSTVVNWMVSGMIDDDQKKIVTKNRYKTAATELGLQCSFGSGGSMPIPATDSASNPSPLDQFELPSLVGSSKTITFPAGSAQSTLTLTIVQTD